MMAMASKFTQQDKKSRVRDDNPDIRLCGGSANMELIEPVLDWIAQCMKIFSAIFSP